MLGPLDVEIGYRQREERFYRFLAHHSSPLLIVVGTGFLSVLFFWVDRIFNQAALPFTPELNFKGFPFIRLGIETAVFLSLMSFLVSAKQQVFFLLFCTSAIWWSTSRLVLEPLPSLDHQAIVIGGFFSLLLGTYIFTREKFYFESINIRALAFTAFFFSVLSLILFYPGASDQWSRYWPLRFHYLWYIGLISIYARESSFGGRLKSLLPVFAMRGMLWPPDTRWAGEDRSQKTYLWWWGFSNIALGYLLMIIRFAVIGTRQWTQVYSFKDYGGMYFLGAIDDVAIGNIIAGIARIYGFQVRDATNFLLLSRTPNEIWKRSSVYNYMFILRYVYVPAYSILKNRYLVTLLAFTFFYLNQFGYLDFFNTISYAVGGPLIAMSHNFVPGGRFLQVLTFATLIYISQRYWFFSHEKQESGWTGWISIILTFAIEITCGYGAGRLQHRLLSGHWF